MKRNKQKLKAIERNMKLSKRIRDDAVMIADFENQPFVFTTYPRPAGPYSFSIDELSHYGINERI